MPSELHFLGCSVTSVNATLGFGSDVSQLQLGLVADHTAGQLFISPSIGAPYYFSYGAFYFGGICQNWNTSRGQDGDPLYNVTLADPRGILEGVQLIINNYTGSTFSIPNLYNIYGYLEAIQYGFSGVNDNGIEWWKISTAFLDLQNGTNAISGTPIRFAGNNYYLDLRQLPTLPNYYRIGGESVSLMDFISEICDAASHDFFFKLSNDIYGRHIITLYTISRRNQPTLGKITNFVNLQDDFIKADAGFELRNETASKFVVGGNVALNYIQHNSGDAYTYIDTDHEDDTILQYFGLDESGNVLIPQGLYGDQMWVEVPSRMVNVVGVGETYKTDIEELRSALAGQDEWEFLLDIYNDDASSIHFKKYERLGMYDTLTARTSRIADKTLEELRSLTPLEMVNLTGDSLKKAGDAIYSDHETNMNRMYQFVRSYAEEYLGKKYMVRVPFVLAKLEETFNTYGYEIKTTLEPTDGGFLEEVYWSGAVSNNLLPQDVNWATLEDGRIKCYVKFQDYPVNGKSRLDTSDLSTNDYTLGPNSLFVQGNVQPKLQFLDRRLARSPRAIVELPGMVKTLLSDTESKRETGLIQAALVRKIMVIKGLTNAQALQYFRNLLARFGSEITFLGREAIPRVPIMACVPLKSNVDFYGPWYATGAQGKVEFESDPDLVPWNYGGYAYMNLAGNARVSEALSNFLIGEAGSVELVGQPIVDLGGTVVSQGPYVTDINIQRSPQGITTTYRMQIWTPRFGKVEKQFLDKQRKFNKVKQEQRRLMREVKKVPPPGSDLFKARKSALFTRGHRMTASTSMMAICAEGILESGTRRKANVVFSPPSNIMNHLGESGYTDKAISSLDALFRPFTTATTSDNLPHYETPSANGITLTSLNPYSRDNDFILYNAEYPADDEDLIDGSGDIRGVALRGPVMIAGWGYDTAGNPVPSVSGNFIPDYKKRMDQWKVGPLDARWDDNRKVWVAGGVGSILGKSLSSCGYRSSGVVGLYELTSSGLHITHNVYAKDWLLPSGDYIYSNRNVMLSFINNNYYYIAVEPTC